MSVFANVCIFGSPLSFVRFRLKVTPQTAWTTTRTTTRRTRTTTRTATTTTTTTTANRSQEDTKVSPSSDSKGSFLAPLACLSVPPVQQTPRTVPVSLAQPWDARVDGEDYVLPNTFKSKKPTLSKVQTPKDPRQASQDNVVSNPFRKKQPHAWANTRTSAPGGEREAQGTRTLDTYPHPRLQPRIPLQPRE